MNRLREIRVVKRVTQFQLRIATGIHQSRISLIENGWVPPKSEEMQKLSKALGALPQDIFPESKGEK